MNTPLMEYKKHKCQQYNINASLIGEEKYIITGSEENKVKLKINYLKKN